MTDQQSAALQVEACKLIGAYKLFLPATVKDFFKRLAVSLNWKTLEAML